MIEYAGEKVPRRRANGHRDFTGSRRPTDYRPGVTRQSVPCARLFLAGKKYAGWTYAHKVRCKFREDGNRGWGLRRRVFQHHLRGDGQRKLGHVREVLRVHHGAITR